MNKNIEKEYKILLSREQFYSLLDKYPSLNFVEQINVYYDNKTCDIGKLKGAMRIRTKRNVHMFTLKIPSQEGLLEYECLVNDNNTDVLEKDEIISLLSTYHVSGPFFSIAKLKTARASYINEDAELCFDISEYNESIDYEVEYEYRRDHDGLSAFNKILNEIGVTYHHNCKSKIARALQK